MSLKQPLDSGLSPLANWLLILVLLVPVTGSMAVLEAANLGSWTALAVASLIAVTAVSAAVWDRYRLLRGLPLLYGIAFGIGVKITHGDIDRWGLLEGLAAGLTLGLLATFSIWIETRGEQGRKQPDRTARQKP